MLDRTSIGTVAPRLAQLVRMLASPIDGEALSAARALGRALAGAKLDFHDLASLIEDAAVPFAYAPRPSSRPAPSPTEWPSPASKPKPEPKPKSEPNPWPTWGTLRHSQVVAWLYAIDTGPHSIEKNTRPVWDELMRQIICRPHELLTRKQINLFNRLVRSTWEKGVRT